jgi:hypothetical protein
LRVLVDQLSRIEEGRECEDSHVAHECCNIQAG